MHAFAYISCKVYGSSHPIAWRIDINDDPDCCDYINGGRERGYGEICTFGIDDLHLDRRVKRKTERSKRGAACVRLRLGRRAYRNYGGVPFSLGASAGIEYAVSAERTS